MCSSDLSVCGQPAQASYSAASSFLGAFVRYRHSLGLPAAVIDLGIVGDIGRLIGADRHLLETTLRGYMTIGEKEIFRAIEVAMMRQEPGSVSEGFRNSQFAVGLTPLPKDSPHHINSLLHGDRRIDLLRPALTHAQPVQEEASRVQRLFSAMSQDATFRESEEAATLTQQEVIHRLSCLSGSNEQNVGLQQPFSQLGLDSLVVVELRIWVQRTFHIQASVPEIMGTGHIEGLTQLILSRVKPR